VFTALLAVMIFATILENHTISNVPFLRTPFAIIGVTLSVLWLAIHLKSLKLRNGPELRAMLMLCIFSLIWLLNYATDPNQRLLTAFSYFMGFAQPVILFFIVSDLIRRMEITYLVWSFFILMTLLMAFLTLFVPGLSVEGGDGRFGLAGINLNRLAFAYAMSLLTLFWLILRYPRAVFRGLWTPLIVGIATALISWCFIAAGSRGVFLAFCGGLILLAFLELDRRTIPSYIFLFLPGLAGFVWAILESGVILNRLAQALEGADMGMRDILLRQAIDLASQSPWTGHSYTYYSKLGIASGLGRPIDVHNGIFQIVLPLGYPALFIWFWFLSSLGTRLWKQRRNPTARLFFILFCFNLAFMLIGGVASNTTFWIFLACAANAHSATPASLDYIARKLRKSQPTNHSRTKQVQN
jgi:O-antigen ligase